MAQSPAASPPAPPIRAEGASVARPSPTERRVVRSPQRVRASSSAPAASAWRAVWSVTSFQTVATRPMSLPAVGRPVSGASLSVGRWQHARSGPRSLAHQRMQPARTAPVSGTVAVACVCSLGSLCPGLLAVLCRLTNHVPACRAVHMWCVSVCLCACFISTTNARLSRRADHVVISSCD